MAPRNSKNRQWCCSRVRCANLSLHREIDNPKYAFSANLERNCVNAKVGRTNLSCLVDSGAALSCINQHVLKQISPNAQVSKSSLGNVVGVCGEIHPVLGETTLPIQFGDLTLKHTFKVFETLHAKVILGIDFLRKHKIQTDFGEMTLKIPFNSSGKSNSTVRGENLVGSITVQAFPDPNTPTTIVSTVRETIIPPHSETILPVRVPNCPNDTVVMLEPALSFGRNLGLAGSKSVCKVENSTGLYMVINPTAVPIFLKPNTRIAKAHPVQDSEIQVLETPTVASVNSLSSDHVTAQEYKNIVLDLGINLENTNLSAEQKEKLYNFLGKNRDIFAKDLSELGQTDLHHHTILTKDETPISSGPYRLNPKMRQHVDKALDEMLEYGIIEESDSAYHSPIVLVKKKGSDEFRFCADFRLLNQNSVPNSFPIPTVSEVFDIVADSEAEIFSSLDLRSGFWQVPLDPATKHKSAFITHRGVYQFTRLPFGLSGSPKSFQSLMAKVLKDMNFKVALVYIDDVLIFSKNFDQHLIHLQQLFANLRRANLKLHPSKCNFATNVVKYLGHIVSKDGVKVCPENTEKIRNFPRPNNAKQVKSFLGTANYYRRFIKDFAKIVSPLNSLLKKNQRFCWTAKCQQAFDDIKERLTSAPILSYPCFDLPFILTTDASDVSIGYMLSQMQDGKEHAIAYGGRSLSGSELKWHITDKEALALVESVQHFRHYLASQKFTVFTDNVSVKYLQKIKDCNGRLGRWSLLLQAYDFEIKHKAGKSNPADFLSRQVYSETKPTFSSELIDHVSMMDSVPKDKQYSQITFVYDGETEDAVIANLDDPSDLDPGIQRPDLATLQLQCPDLYDIYNYKLNNIVPDDPFVARTIVAESYNFEIEDGVLKHFYSRRCKNVPKNERLVKQVAVPKVLRDDVLRSYHDCIAGGGHQGFERTYASLRNKYYWPSMYSDIKQYVQSCEACQRSKRDFHARPPPLHPQPVDDVLSRWHMDILSGLPTTKDKYKHILLIVDSCSKWCEAFPLRTQEATEVAAVLYKEVFTRFGAPRTLITDRAQNFRSKLIQALCELFSVTRHLTSAYHPQSNGTVERMNSVVLQTLRAYSRGQQDDWPELLPGIMMAYRATPSTQSTNLSPFFMCFGREMRLPLDTALIPKEHLAQGHREFLSSTLHNLEKARKLANQDIEAAQQRYKRNHDKRAQPPEFRPAQRVWLYCTKVPLGKAPKLHCKWVGPYYITQVCPKHTFKLRNCSTNKEVKSLVNARRLKPYYDPADRPTNPPPDMENNEVELDPEEIPDPVQPERQQPRGPQPQPNVQVRPAVQPPQHAHKEPVVPPQLHQPNMHRTQPPTKQTQEISKNNHPSTSSGSKSKNLKNPTIPQSSTLKPAVTQTKANEKSHDSHEASTKPSCQDCRQGKCKPFATEEIEAIVSSARGNGTLYYKVKFVDKQKHSTDWYFPCKLPSQLIRQFHADRTMQGKKRKRPLQDKQHKFFEKTEKTENSVQTIHTVCNSSTQTEKSTNPEKTADNQIQQDSCSCFKCDPYVNKAASSKIIGLHFTKRKPFYAIPDSSGEVHWYSASHVHKHVNDLYWEIRNAYDNIMLESDIHNLRHAHKFYPRRHNRSIKRGDFIVGLDTVLEMRTTADGKRECFTQFRNPNIPPSWFPLEHLSPFTLNNMMDVISRDYFASTSSNRW